jgi:hypothetical protein
MTTQPEVEFRPSPPRHPWTPAAADFREFTRVRNLVYREIAGNDDDAYTPEELLPHYQPSDDEIRHAWTVIATARSSAASASTFLEEDRAPRSGSSNCSPRTTDSASDRPDTV